MPASLGPGDFEPPINIYAEDDEEFDDYEQLIVAQRQVLVDFLQGVDALVMDAQYTDAEYAAKIGWGHGTYSKCISLAQAAGVPRLYLTHHDPTRTDTALDAIYADILASQSHGDRGLEIFMASEGLAFDV